MINPLPWVVAEKKMTHLDYGVLIAYLVGIVLVGVLLSRRNRTSADMFAAGGSRRGGPQG